MDKKIFKAYDIRGKYPGEINEKVVFEIAAKASRILGRKIVVAHDARLSSTGLYQAVIKAFSVRRSAARGRKTKTPNPIPHTLYPVGLATTPMFYFLVNHLKGDGGVMVTASHNPKEYNGLKIVGKYAQPISGEEVYELFK